MFDNLQEMLKRKHRDGRKLQREKEMGREEVGKIMTLRRKVELDGRRLNNIQEFLI